MPENTQIILNARLEELSRLIDANPVYLPVAKAAEFLHVKPRR